MRKIAALIAAVAVTPLIVAAAPAPQADVNYEIEVGSGETVTVENSDSPETGGTNLPGSFVFGPDAETCGADQQNRCDRVLVKFTASGAASFDFTGSLPVADYDLAIYESDANATLGEEVATSGNTWAPADLGCDPVFGLCGMTGESAAIDVSAGYYLVVIHYFFAGGGYTMDVSLG